MPTKISPGLWFDNQAEDATRFYTAIFKDSKIVTSNARLRRRWITTGSGYRRATMRWRSSPATPGCRMKILAQQIHLFADGAR
jgi:hypothetical protein